MICISRIIRTGVSGPLFGALLLFAISFLSACNSSPNVTMTLSSGSTQAMDIGQALPITAHVVGDSKNEGVTWTLTSGPGTLTNSSSTSTTYNANGATGTAIITATSVRETKITLSVTITVSAVPQFTTTSLPAVTEGSAYNQSVYYKGGTGNCTMTISSGALPPGLSMSSSGSITGTPSGPNGTANFSVKMTDSSTVTPVSVTQPLSIVVNLPAAPAFTTKSLPSGTEGVAYSQQLAATGLAPLAFTVTSGSLPAGLLMSGSGLISGTPTGPNGNAQFSVKVTDASNPVQSATEPLSIQIGLPAPPSITTASLPAGLEGTTYNQTLSASGGSGTLTFSISSGTLPAGLALSSAGIISGKPTGPNGTSNFTAQVKDQSNPPQTATKSLSILINLPPAPTMTPATLPNGAVATPYNQSLTVTGGLAPFTWSVSSGTLPAGLTLNPNGASATIIGTPTTAQTNVAFTIQAADSSNPVQKAAQPYSVTIAPPPPLTVSTTSAQLPSGTVAIAYPATNLAATGGYPPYSWLLVSPGAGPLPPGLTFGSSGQITGTPTSAGTYPFTVQVTDSKSGQSTANLSITISSSPGACQSGGNLELLKGQYAFVVSGFDPTPTALAGSFDADGKGNIGLNVGMEDWSRGSGTSHGAPAPLISSGSSYTIGPDNRGCLTLDVSTQGTQVFRFSLGNFQTIGGTQVATRGFLIESDATGTVTTGVLALQDPTAFSAFGNPATNTGTFAFGEIANGYGFQQTTIGVLTISANPGGSQANVNGEYDQNSGGTVDGGYGGTLYTFGARWLQGNLGTNPTPGHAVLISGTEYKPSMLKSCYVISATEAFYIDQLVPQWVPNNPAVGRLVKQSGSFSNSTLNANSVLGLSGAGTIVSSSYQKSIAEAGILSIPSSGTFSLAMDINNAGTFTPYTSNTQTHPYSVDSQGRVTTADKSFIMYLVGPNEGFIMDTSSMVLSGYFHPQTGGPFTTASVTGTYAFGSVEPVNNQGDMASGVVTFDGSGNLSGTQDVVSTGNVLTGNKPIKPTTDSISSNGRGVSPATGNLKFIIYLISPTQAVVLDANSAMPFLQFAEK